MEQQSVKSADANGSVQSFGGQNHENERAPEAAIFQICTV
jgi:hypothetical protein